MKTVRYLSTLAALLITILATAPATADGSLDGVEQYAGTIAGIILRNNTMVGAIEGDLRGVVEFDLETGEGAISTRAGNLNVSGFIRIRQFGDMNIWLGAHQITGGTGDFEGAQGYMLAIGIVDPSGAVLLQYRAVVALP